jgi:hypothetical protein
VHHFDAEPISDYGNLQSSTERFIPEDNILFMNIFWNKERRRRINVEQIG